MTSGALCIVFIYQVHSSMVPGTEEAFKYLWVNERVNEVTPKVVSRNLPKEYDGKVFQVGKTVHEVTEVSKSTVSWQS